MVAQITKSDTTNTCHNETKTKNNKLKTLTTNVQELIQISGMYLQLNHQLEKTSRISTNLSKNTLSMMVLKSVTPIGLMFSKCIVLICKIRKKVNFSKIWSQLQHC